MTSCGGLWCILKGVFKLIGTADMHTVLPVWSALLTLIEHWLLIDLQYFAAGSLLQSLLSKQVSMLLFV